MSTITKDQNNSGLVKEQEYNRVLTILRTTMPSLSKVDDTTAILALAYAKHLGLDPLKKEIHLIPYWDDEQKRYVIQPVVAYTEYLKRAEATGKLDGWEVEFGEDEKLGRYATVTIYRKDRSKPVKWTVYEQEVKKDTKIWQKQPLFMLRKVAIAQAFRMAFPTETSMLPYEEVEQWIPEVADNIPENKEVEPEDTKSEYITEQQRRRFFAIVKKGLGYNEEFIKEMLKTHFGIESTKEIKQDQYEEIIDFFKKLSTPVKNG